jgi:hypothetical protein
LDKISNQAETSFEEQWPNHPNYPTRETLNPCHPMLPLNFNNHNPTLTHIIIIRHDQPTAQEGDIKMGIMMKL